MAAVLDEGSDSLLDESSGTIYDEDGAPAVAVTGADTAAGTDTATVGVPAAGTDTGTGTDTGSASAAVTAADTGAGAGSAAAGVSVTGTDSGSGSDTAIIPFTYYVSPSGSDSNDGLSAGSAWQTISKVNAATLNAGGTVLFEGGQTFSGTLLFLEAEGTADSPITIGSYGTGRATISNTGNDAIYIQDAGGYVFDSIIVQADSAHNGIGFFCSGTGRHPALSFYGVKCTGSKWGLIIGAGESGDGYDGITTGASDDGTWCDFSGNVYAGMFTYGPDFDSGSPAYAHTGLSLSHITADGNLGNSSDTSVWSGSGIVISSVNGGTGEYLEAHGNGTENGCATNGPAGVFVYACKDVVIRYSVAYSNRNGSGHADGDGFDIDIDNVGCVIEYSLSYDNDGSGYLCWGSSGDSYWGSAEVNTVRYCIGWGNARDAAAASNFHGELTFGGNLAGANAYGNTLAAFDTSGGGTPSCVSVQSGTMSGLRLFNNLLLQTGSGPVLLAAASRSVSEIWFLGNLYWSTGTFGISWGGTTYSSLADWRSALFDEDYESTDYGLESDPLLVDAATEPAVTDPADMSGASGLMLTSGSPCIGAGIDLESLFSLDAGSQDFYGYPVATPLWVGAFQAVLVSGADTAAGTDSGSTGEQPAGTDTATGTDTASLAAAVSGADTGTGTDTATAAAAITGADTGTGTDAASVTAAVSGADTAAGTDTASTGPAAAADTATGTSTATAAVLTAPDVINTWTKSRQVNSPGFAYGRPMSGSLDCPVASSAGTWLIAICSWTLPPGFAGATMEVADDVHGWWVPLGAPSGDTDAGGYTRCSIWARPGGSPANPVPAAGHVYVAPAGMPGLVYPAVIGVTVIEVTGMSPYAGIPAVVTASINGASSIAAGAGAPLSQALMVTVAASDAAVFSSGPGAGWTALAGVGVAATAPVILHTSPAWQAATTAQAASWATGTSGDLSACTAVILASNPAPSQPNPAWPATQLQCAFGSGALTPRSQMTWTDISQRFLAGQETSAQRGKNRQLDQTQAASITLTLDNSDSALDPGNTTSPYAPHVVADTPIRLLMTWEGRTYPQFMGYVSKWPQQWKDGTRQGLAAVTVTDSWSLLIDQLAACQQAEMLLTGPYAYWTCGDAAGSAYAANQAPGNQNVLTVVESGSGALTAVADFGADSGANQGDPSGTLWSQSGLTSGDNGYGYCLVCSDQNYPTLDIGTTVMGWFSPTGGATQVNAGLCLMRASNAATGPLWQVDLINPASGTDPGGTQVTVWDKVTRAATTTVISASDYLIPPLGGITHFAMMVTQTTWQLIVNGGAFTGGSGSCNLPPVMSWLSFMGTADRFSTGGMLNGECCHLGVYPMVLPADRVTQIVIAGWPQIDGGQFASETPARRIERLMGYGGWSGPRAISTSSATQMAAITDIQGSAGNVSADGVISAGQGQQAGQAITNIVASDNGFMSVDGGGVLCYQSRGDFYGQPPAWFIGELAGKPLNAGWALVQGTESWTVSGGSATFAPSPAWNYLGYPSGLLTPDGVTAAPAITSGMITGLSGGTAYLISAAVNCPAGYGAGLTAGVTWYDSTGTLISTVAGSAAVLPASTPGGTLVSATLTSPPGTASAEVTFTYAGTPLASQYAYLALPMLQPADSAGTGGEYPAQGDITFSEDKALLYNTAQLTQSTGTGVAVTAANVPSALQHGQSPFTATVYQEDQDVVADEANWVVGTQGTPVNRFETLTVNAAANPVNWPFVLGVEPGTPLQAARRPVTAQTPTVVQGIAAQVTRKFDFLAGTAEVTITGDTFPEGQVLTADDPLLGQLNGVNRLGW